MKKELLEAVKGVHGVGIGGVGVAVQHARGAPAHDLFDGLGRDAFGDGQGRGRGVAAGIGLQTPAAGRRKGRIIIFIEFFLIARPEVAGRFSGALDLVHEDEGGGVRQVDGGLAADFGL